MKKKREFRKVMCVFESNLKHKGEKLIIDMTLTVLNEKFELKKCFETDPNRDENGYIREMKSVLWARYQQRKHSVVVGAVRYSRQAVTFQQAPGITINSALSGDVKNGRL